MRRNFAMAAALLLSLTPALAQQQAPVPQQQPAGAAGHPPANPELRAARKAMRQACVEDVHTLCAGSEPGGGKIMMCLRSHMDQVSDGCKAATRHLRDVRRGA
jgi:hypothetical protein